MTKIALFCSLLFFCSNVLLAQQFSFQPQLSNTNASLRGLHVVNDTIIWASGAKGTLLHSLDGGTNWSKIPTPDSLDFRSLWAFNAQEALIASAGQPARIYRTTNKGSNWQLVYEDTTGQGFFDALHFWDKQHGWALSDPVDGKILLLETKDGGINWQPVKTPAVSKGEAFFAASNGSIAMAGKQKAWIGTGGSAIRILSTADAGKSWKDTSLPVPLFSEAAGIYALTFLNEKKGVAVGGAYDKPAEGKHAAYFTTDGGKNWAQADGSPSGYRSGVAWHPTGKVLLSVGTKGTDISRDGGKSWKMLNTENLNSIRFSPSGKKGWAVGANGAVFLINVTP